MDHKALDKIFQEIKDEFSNMAPTSLDKTEDKVYAAMLELGSYLMECKMEDWDTQVRQEKCSECGTRLKHRKVERHIATWVSDMTYKGDRSYCPKRLSTHWMRHFDRIP